MYGDFEAQRHWMEIALNVPVRDWYFPTPANNLSYWGLDYPPLSGYASWLYGRFLQFVDADSVALYSSRGFESEPVRAAMRSTVLISDVLIFLPSLAMYALSANENIEPFGSPTIAFVAFIPALMLMDHGHFQYNSVSLGLCVLAFVLYQRRLDVAAAISFCTAVYFKHLCLYFALALFAHHASRVLQIARERSIQFAVAYASRILIAILAVTLFVFGPWIFDHQSMLAVLRRLFPVARGLYEDKVANFWCSISVFFKAQRYFSHAQLVALCTIVTFVTSLPFCIAMFFRKTRRHFLLSCSGCALAAYLFSFQVHEKQILIPLISLALLFDTYPTMCMWMSFAAATSLFPLLHREGLTVAYIAVSILHFCLALHIWPDEIRSRCETSGRFRLQVFIANLLRICTVPIVLLGLALHVALLAVKPPSWAPDILVLLVTGYCCAIFCCVYLAIIVNLWVQP